MRIIEEKQFNKLVADEGKHIRDINDVYIPSHYEDGNLIEEHFPYYFIEAYIPKNVAEEQINNLYVEETNNNN